MPSKEGPKSMSGTVGSCDSGMLGGGFVRAPARRERRWIWAARTSSRMVGRLSGRGTPEERGGSGTGCALSVEVAMLGWRCEEVESSARSRSVESVVVLAKVLAKQTSRYLCSRTDFSRYHDAML